LCEHIVAGSTITTNTLRLCYGNN